MSSLKEIVDSLKPGDEVRGVFKELVEDYDEWMEPTGETYVAAGTVYSYKGLRPGSQGLSIRTKTNEGNGQCLRQTDGAPGHWLVSLEVLKKGTE